MLLDDLEVKRLLKANEKKLQERMDRFEQEARELRKVDHIKDEKRLEADTLARKQEEERARDFARREEEFERSKRQFEDVQRRLQEEQAAARKRREAAEEDALEERRAFDKMRKEKNREFEERMQGLLARQERDMNERIEKLESQLAIARQELAKRPVASKETAEVSRGGTSAASTDQVKDAVDAESKKPVEAVKRAELAREAEREQRLDAQMRRQRQDLNSDMTTLEARVDGKVERLESAIADVDKERKRIERLQQDLSAEQNRLRESQALLFSFSFLSETNNTLGF